jgi:hypothetical protein
MTSTTRVTRPTGQLVREVGAPVERETDDEAWERRHDELARELAESDRMRNRARLRMMLLALLGIGLGVLDQFARYYWHR